MKIFIINVKNCHISHFLVQTKVVFFQLLARIKKLLSSSTIVIAFCKFATLGYSDSKLYDDDDVDLPFKGKLSSYLSWTSLIVCLYRLLGPGEKCSRSSWFVVISDEEINSIGCKMVKSILVIGLTDAIFDFTVTDSSYNTDSLDALFVALVLRSVALLSLVCWTNMDM